jgi:hypothetical protein
VDEKSGGAKCQNFMNISELLYFSIRTSMSLSTFTVATANQKVTGKKPLPATQAKHFKNPFKILGDEIVQSWVNYFVYHKNIVPKKISGKL